MVSPYRLVLYMTIDHLGRHGGLSHFRYIEKNYLSITHDHKPSSTGKTGLMAFIYTTKPAVSKNVGHTGACVFVD